LMVLAEDPPPHADSANAPASNAAAATTVRFRLILETSCSLRADRATVPEHRQSRFTHS
jgi:hypothetical protein